MGDHGLRDHVRRLPAARRARGGRARAAEGLPRRCARLHRRLVHLRSRLVGRRADHGTRGAGPGRCDHHACCALDRHDDVRRRRRAEQGARHLGRDRRRRCRCRRARGRPADQVPGLGVDLLRQRPGRRHRLRARPALRPREPPRPRLDPGHPRRDRGHGRSRAARLRGLERARTMAGGRAGRSRGSPSPCCC